MEDLIKQAFVSVDLIGPQVQAGHYDLTGPDGEIILPTVWEKVVQPDWQVKMVMWPPPGKAGPRFPPMDPRDLRDPREGRHHHRHGGPPAQGMSARVAGLARGRPGMQPPPPPSHGFPPGPPPPGYGPRVGGLRGAPRVPPGAAQVIDVNPGPDERRKKKSGGGGDILNFLSGGKPKKSSSKK